MRLRLQLQNRSALTLMEVLFVIVAILVLAAVLLTFLTRRKVHIQFTKCQNNLKQVGLAFKVFCNDSDDRFPFAMPGSLAYRNETLAWQHFQSMSNEIGSAAVLICPQDSQRIKHLAYDFTSGPKGLQSMTNRAVSYFIGLSAQEDFPNSLLSGDRNLVATAEAANPWVLSLATNTLFRWGSDLHTNRGHITLADGSVQNMDRWQLQAHLARSMGVDTNRLLLPLVP